MAIWHRIALANSNPNVGHRTTCDVLDTGLEYDLQRTCVTLGCKDVRIVFVLFFIFLHAGFCIGCSLFVTMGLYSTHLPTQLFPSGLILACCFGSLMPATITRHHSSTWYLIVGLIVTIIGWIPLIFYQVGPMEMAVMSHRLIVGYSLHGIGTGILLPVASLCLFRITTSTWRDHMTMLPTVLAFAGITVAFLLSMHIASVLVSVAGLVLNLLAIFCLLATELPNGKHENTMDIIPLLMNGYVGHPPESKSAGCKNLFHNCKETLPKLRIIVGVVLAQQLLGTCILASYSAHVCLDNSWAPYSACSVRLVLHVLLSSLMAACCLCYLSATRVQQFSTLMCAVMQLLVALHQLVPQKVCLMNSWPFIPICLSVGVLSFAFGWLSQPFHVTMKLFTKDQLLTGLSLTWFAVWLCGFVILQIVNHPKFLYGDFPVVIPLSLVSVFFCLWLERSLLSLKNRSCVGLRPSDSTHE